MHFNSSVYFGSLYTSGLHVFEILMKSIFDDETKQNEHDGNSLVNLAKETV